MSHRDRVFQIIASVAESDEPLANPNLDLFATQTLDSLQTVELIVKLSDAFDVSISPADFDRAVWATPNLIVSQTEQLIRERARA